MLEGGGGGGPCRSLDISKACDEGSGHNQSSHINKGRPVRGSAVDRKRIIDATSGEAYE